MSGAVRIHSIGVPAAEVHPESAAAVAPNVKTPARRFPPDTPGAGGTPRKQEDACRVCAVCLSETLENAGSRTRLSPLADANPTGYASPCAATSAWSSASSQSAQVAPAISAATAPAADDRSAVLERMERAPEPRAASHKGWPGVRHENFAVISPEGNSPGWLTDWVPAWSAALGQS